MIEPVIRPTINIDQSVEFRGTNIIKYPPGSILLYYKSKEDEKLLKAYCEYSKARNNIEIIPIDNEKFDAFSFIDFALALSEKSVYNYYVKDPIKTISHTKDSSVLVFSTF